MSGAYLDVLWGGPRLNPGLPVAVDTETCALRHGAIAVGLR